MRRRTFAVVAAALLPAVALAGCGGTATTSGVTTSGSGSVGPSSPAAGTASPNPSSSLPTSCATGLQVSVKGSTVTPAPATTDVKAGCEVQLTVTADRSSEVHVHVVDIEQKVRAGTPTTVRFTPKEPGVYEVELHEPELLLVKLAVR